MTLSLSVPNRAFAKFVLQSIQTGSILEMRLRKEGLEMFDFTLEDLKKYAVTVDEQTGNMSWGNDAWETMCDLVVSEGVKNLLVGRLEQMSEQKNFNVQLLPLADALGIEKEKARTEVPKEEEKKL